ncbi:RING finger protein 43, partial [Ophiophagus hannah]
MSVGPQLQLAVLWPWLLMAMLQIRLGYSGLALVAAMEAERTLAQKAIIRVIPFKLEPLTLEGVFASIAEITPAEGKLLQLGAKASVNVAKEKERHLPFHWATGTNRLSPKSEKVEEWKMGMENAQDMVHLETEGIPAQLGRYSYEKHHQITRGGNNP